MDYADAVNEEIQDLFAAGADVVQIDEPYMQARPEKARQYGLQALNRALDGVHGHDRGAHLLRLRGDHPRAAERLLVPARARAAAAAARSRSRRRSRTSTARVLAQLDGKQIMVGCIDLSDTKVETPEMVAERIERALPVREARERDPRARLRHEVPAARGGAGQAASDGGGGADPAAGTRSGVDEGTASDLFRRDAAGVAAAALRGRGSRCPRAAQDGPLRLVVPFGAGTTTDIVSRVVAEALGQALAADRGGGEPRRRRRLHRLRPGRQGRARRPHHRDGHGGHACDQCVAVPQAALRPAEGLRAAGPGGFHADPAGGGRRFAGQDAGRPGALAARPRRHHLRLRRQRHLGPPGRRDAGAAPGRQDDPCAVQGRRHGADRRDGPARWTSCSTTRPPPCRRSRPASCARWAPAARSAAPPRPTCPRCRSRAWRDFDLVAWFMLYAPAATPPAALARLRRAAAAALARRTSMAKLHEQGVEQRRAAYRGTASPSTGRGRQVGASW